MTNKDVPGKRPDGDANKTRARRTRLILPAALAALLGSGGDLAEPVERDADAIDAADESSEAAAWAGAEPHLRRAAEATDPELRVRLAGLLPSALARMPDLDRVRVISSWATATSPLLRLAMARALRYAPPAVGLHSALEHLSRDPDPAVRVAVAEAAWLRRREAPGRLITVLQRLAVDQHVFVREVARLALADA
jgi:hypothetical protein